MAEWSNAVASKAIMPKGIGGSNPPLSAIFKLGGFEESRAYRCDQDKKKNAGIYQS